METSSLDTLAVPIVVAVLSSNVITAIVSSFINRRKLKAETKSLEATSENTINKTILEYSDGLREDIKELREELSTAREIHETLRDDYEELFKKCALLEAERDSIKQENIRLNTLIPKK